MKYLLLLLLANALNMFSQADIFNVETIKTGLLGKESGFYKLEHYTPYFYEDENYIVTSECHGEFGGEIYFKNKKDGTATVGYATCPVIINKIDNKYYLTTSLAHLGGFYGFYEIDDPRELTIKANDSVYQGRGELMAGIKTLTGGMNKTILLSFKYNSGIYHIVCDRETNENYIAIRENATLKKIQTLNTLSIMASSNAVRLTKDGHYSADFMVRKTDSNYLKSGYIDIFENKIKIYLYE